MFDFFQELLILGVVDIHTFYHTYKIGSLFSGLTKLGLLSGFGIFGCFSIVAFTFAAIKSLKLFFWFSVLTGSMFSILWSATFLFRFQTKKMKYQNLSSHNNGA